MCRVGPDLAAFLLPTLSAPPNIVLLLWMDVRRCGVLFVDNPVGTGFSIACSEEDVPRDQQGIAAHLHYALQSFISENPTFELRPLFLAGESYAGKYVPSLAYYLVKHLHSGIGQSIAAQLVGIAVGNGLTHPRTQVTVSGCGW